MSAGIIHVDMDAFYAAVEARDNPDLAGKPLVIGSLPHERGVVSTCSYEARKFGLHSAMSIKEAYRLCPDAVYMHPNYSKYAQVSEEISTIWSSYTDLVEHVSLDEAYLDVTGSEHLFGGAVKIGREIKERIKNEVGLSCSVGIGYCMMAAKLASEENKPDGFFEIPTKADLISLISQRDVRIIPGIGGKTAKTLNSLGIKAVDDILKNSDLIISKFGNNGKHILALAQGMDMRSVTPFSEPKSLGKEHTFQKDVSDFDALYKNLRFLARELGLDMQFKGMYCRTITVKVKYSNMKSVTRSKTADPINRPIDIYKVAQSLLDKIERAPIRLIGLSLSNFTKNPAVQLSFEDVAHIDEKRERLDKIIIDIQKKHGRNSIKSASEIC